MQVLTPWPKGRRRGRVGGGISKAGDDQLMTGRAVSAPTPLPSNPSASFQAVGDGGRRRPGGGNRCDGVEVFRSAGRRVLSGTWNFRLKPSFPSRPIDAACETGEGLLVHDGGTPWPAAP